MKSRFYIYPSSLYHLCDNTAVSTIVVKYQRNTICTRRNNKHCVLCRSITVPYGSLYYFILMEIIKRASIRAYQGLLTKAFLRHCSAKHCLHHGSDGGIYF